MKIAIVGAMAQEVEILTALLQHKQTYQIAHSTIYEGELAGKQVAILQSGIGKVAAAMGTTALIQLTQPDLVINTGSAGGICAELKVGDIVISTETCHHDADVTAFGYAKGQLPNCPATFPSDEKLVSLAESTALSQGQNVKKGLICSGDSFIQGGTALAQIKQHFPNAIAVEMEAAAIAQVCHAFQRPFVVVRAISDNGNGEANLSFEEFLPLAAKQSSNLVLQMLEKLGE